MSWKDVENAFDKTRPEDIIIHLDLERFGELVGRVVSETHRLNGLEQFDPHTEAAHHLVIDAWRYVCHMADRAEFVRQTQADLAALDAPEPKTPPSITPDHLPFGHLPEFGGAAPLPRRAPTELERRMEPPV